MRRVLALSILATLAAACGPGDLGADAGSDDIDASEGMGGLVFQFSVPGIDVELDEVKIERLRLFATNLRANGDAGPSLDTYREEQDLQFEKADAFQEVKFERAPPGRYSAFEFGLERRSDMDAAWDVRGEVDVDGENHALEIEDEQSSTVSLPLDVDLAPGETIEIAITIDLALMLTTAGVDWDTAPVDGDEIVIDEDSPALLAALRAALLLSFQVESITPVR